VRGASFDRLRTEAAFAVRFPSTRHLGHAIRASRDLAARDAVRRRSRIASAKAEAIRDDGWMTPFALMLERLTVGFLRWMGFTGGAVGQYKLPS
jgi:hypothetical protein